MRALWNRFITGSTMYYLMVRFLLGLVVIAVGLSFWQRLLFEPTPIIVTTVAFVFGCYVFNKLFAAIFRVRPNPESWLISALILSLIVGPLDLSTQWLGLIIAAGAAMGSKYILKIDNRHIFNPTATGVVVMQLTTGIGSSWWIGLMPLTIFVVLGGLVIVHKIKRLPMIGIYVVSYLLFFFLLNGLQLSLGDNGKLAETLLLNSPLFFFAFVMLPEPATSPTGRQRRLLYVVIVAAVGILLQRFLPNIPYSLEASLFAGNIFTRVAERGRQYAMTLAEKKQLAPTIWSFYFEPQPAFSFIPGQFLEWSIPHPNPDSRGARRWFTINSSPTEPHVLVTTRFAEKSSSFKAALQQVKIGDQLFAHGLEGDFVLPTDKSRPLVFIAGGIGITPFRSMVKYLLDRGESRDIILLYATKTVEDLIFMDIFHEANEAFGLKIVPIALEPPNDWQGYAGQISLTIIKKEIPDLENQLFYISGPEPMVEAVERLLVDLRVQKSNIRQDFFPGYVNDLLREKS